MKFPKNRANLYIVIREMPGHAGGRGPTALLGSFSEMEDADNFKGACEFEWLDKTKGAPAAFSVVIVTYYG